MSYLVKSLPNFTQEIYSVVVKSNEDKYYLVDGRYISFDEEYETMAFECDPDGVVFNWISVYAESYNSIEDLEKNFSKICNNLESLMENYNEIKYFIDKVTNNKKISEKIDKMIDILFDE